MNRFPLIKLVLFFIIGIIVQKLFPQEFWVLFFIALSDLIILVILYPISWRKAKPLTDLLLIFIFILTGALVYSNYFSRLKAYPFEKLKYNGCEIYGRVKSVELIKEGRLLLNAEIDSSLIESKMHKMNHEFIVRIYEENYDLLRRAYDKLNIGSKFHLKGTIQKARDKKNPGEFDYSAYLFQNNISGIISVYKSTDFLILTGQTEEIYGRILNAFHHLRKGIDDEIQKYHKKRTSALLRGLLLGDYKKIDEESLENFVNAGVIHVLAVSGQHVALIILIFVFMFNRFNVYLKYLFAVIGLIAFVFITGTQVSVVRAVIMGLIFISAGLLNRDKNVYNILALSAFLILICNPNELFSPGFQLSYSAVLSIVYLYPIFKEWINSFSIKSHIIKKIILFGSISLAAQIGTLPFTLAYFHKLSIAAIFANLIVIPVSGFIIYLGIMTLAAGLISGWVGFIFASANSALSDFTAAIVSLLGKSESAFLPINQFSIYDALLYYITLAFLIYVLKKYKNLNAKCITISLTLSTMFLLMTLDNTALTKRNNLTIIGVDVGQGDATLIKFPDGKSGLIDAGNSFNNFSIGEKVILPLMNKLDIQYIDYAFITHLDADHYYGIYKLVEKGKLRVVYKPQLDSLNKDDLEFETFLSRHKCTVKHFSKETAEMGNCRLYFLNHPVLSEGLKPSSNNKSMLLKIVFGNNSFLFTGDAGQEIENRLESFTNGFIKSDVLKAGHHGSKNSSSGRFITAVKPELVFISSGIENRFHHPSPEVLKEFSVIGAKVHRTENDGAVFLTSDGNNISVSDWKKKESRIIFDL